MVKMIDEPFLLIGNDCSSVLSKTFANASVCIYTCKQPDKTSGNEDSAAIIPSGNDAGVLVVADGLGGLAGGDKASATVVNMINDAVKKQLDSTSLRGSILDGIEQANKTILAMGTGSATTIIAVEVNDKTVRSFHAGDSMALIVGQRGKVKYQTISHSPIGYAMESGFMEEDEAMTHDERHLVSNVVGAADLRLELGPLLKLAKRDTLLLGSDGLFDNLTIDEIIEIIRCGPLRQCADELVKACNERMSGNLDNVLSKPDDMTFILYRPVTKESA